MVRKVRKAMAFLLAFALVFSMVRTDQLSVRAETAAETEASQQESVSVQSEEKENEASEEEGDSTPNSEEAPEVPEGSVDDGTGDPAGNTDIVGGTGSGNNGSQNGNEPTTPPVSGEDEEESSTTAVDPTAPTTPSTSEAVSEEVTSEVNTEETSTEESAEETSEEASTEETSEAETETETETATEGETGDEAEELVEKTVRAKVFADGSYSRSADGGTEITLTGVMPEEATVKAYPVEVQIDDAVVLSAYDITIFDGDGEVYQPEDGAIQVKIEDAAVREAVEEDKEISVYHMEDEGAAPEEVGGVAKEDNAVVFDAESFSIYIVTEPGETHYTHTYIFYDGNKVLGKQILSTGEVLNAPETPAKEGYAFTGWYTEQECRDEFKGFGAEEGALSADVTTELYAGFTEVFYVFYMSEADTQGNRYVLHTQKYTDPAAEIITTGVPFQTGNVNEALIGWTTSPDGSTPDENLQLNGTDMTLYPVVAEAHWITFHSMGGTIVDSVYFRAGELTMAPDDPTREGYDFDGWYTEEACEKEYEFGGSLQENIDLYAKWNPRRVNYTVAYWLETVEDGVYAYKESHTQQGLTGNEAGYDELSFEHFTLDRETTDQRPITISGDGTTIKNVYYSRNEYTIDFVDGGERKLICAKEEHSHKWSCFEGFKIVCGKEQHRHDDDCYKYEQKKVFSITAKYESDISHIWEEGKIHEYLDDGYVWQSNLTEKYYSFLQQMPGYDLVLTATKWDGIKYTWGYYLEALDGKSPNGEQLVEVGNRTYYLYHTTTIYGSAPGWGNSGVELTYEEDYFDISGFSQRDKDVPDFKWSSDESYRHAELYYTRNSYKIEFHTNKGAEVISSEYIPYQADISDQALNGYVVEETTTELNGITYYFDGWYDNELCEGEPYSFEGKTMPANNLLLYAKWITGEVTVQFFETEDSSDPLHTQTFDVGLTAEEPNDPVREGYTFVGWVKEDGTPFNFHSQVVEDTNLYARWISEDKYTISYEPGDGTGTPFTDPQGYAEGAMAKVAEVPDDWKAPNEREGIVCWVDEDGTEYYPGKAYEMPNKNVVLTAKWAPVRKTTLTYDFNGGQTSNGKVNIIVDIDVPNGEYTIKDFTGEEAFSKEGYQFVGWTKEKDPQEGAQILKAGDKIEVDTLEPENNVLYAQWKKSVTITVKKLVSGTMGQVDGTFSFTYTIQDENGNQTEEFALTSGGSYSIENLEAGQTVIIKETSANTDGYKTYVYPENGQKPTETDDSYEIVIGEDTQDMTIIFENYRQVTPPTGIRDNVIPFSMMLLTATAGTVWFGLFGRRKRSA